MVSVPRQGSVPGYQLNLWDRQLAHWSIAPRVSRADVGTIPAPASLSQDFPQTTAQDPSTKCSNQPIATLPAFGRLSLRLWRLFAPISPGGTQL